MGSDLDTVACRSICGSVGLAVSHVLAGLPRRFIESLQFRQDCAGTFDPVIARSAATKQSSDVVFAVKHSKAESLDCFAALAMTHQMATFDPVIARSAATKQSSDVVFAVKHGKVKSLDCFAALAMTHQMVTFDPVIARSAATKQSSDVVFAVKHSKADSLDCFAALAMTHQILST